MIKVIKNYAIFCAKSPLDCFEDYLIDKAVRITVQFTKRAVISSKLNWHIKGWFAISHQS